MPELAETKTIPEKPWRVIEWGKDKIVAHGYEIKPIQQRNKKAKWALYLDLPDADTSSVSIDYVDSQYGPRRRHNDHFVVTYCVSREKKVVMVPLGFGDRRIDMNHFSVRTQLGIKEFIKPGSGVVVAR